MKDLVIYLKISAVMNNFSCRQHCCDNKCKF